ncbi:polyphosphate kinase 1 [Aliidiomarina celeris]|uniref:polyphosphate kinase 1 n=1 Tax=Aliidiomarina celeris TaxID=2249428 RepID=UPI000DEB209B|nr:polyphosphate kinase 1 [Aliidiomarina celeris]
MKFYPKELSWLSFNERVLQEAADSSVPTIERVRFLGIFSNNMDEFFSVRVADVKRSIYYARNQSEHDAAAALMDAIQRKVVALQEQFERVNKDVFRALAQKRIAIITEDQTDAFERKWLTNFFRERVKRELIPLLINQQTDLVRAINEEATYLCAEISNGEHIRYAAIELPTDNIDRFVVLPRQRGATVKKVILLDNVLRLCIHDLFTNIVPAEHIRAFSFKLTRDADYRLPHDIDQSVLERMEEGIRQRLEAEPVRLVFDSNMPPAMLRFLREKLKLTTHDSVVAGGRYRNTRDYIDFPNLGHKSLEYKPFEPIRHASIQPNENIFTTLSRNDILLFYPYHTFDHLTEVIRQAAYDPHVQSIQICIYRVAARSRIIRSLVEAVNNGKKVTVVVELQARFDEEANIEWAKYMTQEGIRVLFGIQGLKVHSKIILIKRFEANTIKRYAHIGTGNFNEKTAKIYTDYGLLTAHTELCEDIEQVFQYLESPYRRFKFNQLLVSPVNTREKLEFFIDREIETAKQGAPAEIMLKVNNLVDEAMIIRLYRASRAGVKVRAIVRGMCALRAGVADLSENIEVISIVDRFLEHTRVYCFHNNGEQRVFISSADIMTRNIDHRVEVGCPIHNTNIRKQLIDIFELQWRDNTKARIIDAAQTNAYRPRGNKKKTRSQKEVLQYLQRSSSS